MTVGSTPSPSATGQPSFAERLRKASPIHTPPPAEGQDAVSLSCLAPEDPPPPPSEPGSSHWGKAGLLAGLTLAGIVGGATPALAAQHHAPQVQMQSRGGGGNFRGGGFGGGGQTRTQQPAFQQRQQTHQWQQPQQRQQTPQWQQPQQRQQTPQGQQHQQRQQTPQWQQPQQRQQTPQWQQPQQRQQTHQGQQHQQTPRWNQPASPQWNDPSGPRPQGGQRQGWPQTHGNDHRGPISVRSGGRDYRVPSGAWVTGAHQRYGPNLHTTVVVRDSFSRHHGVFHARDYCRDTWGVSFMASPWGFYSGSNFWLGFSMGESWAMHNYVAQPLYVYSPSTDYVGPQILPPAGQSSFSNETQAQLAVLQGMSNQVGSNGQVDPTAGLYRYDPSFDADETLQLPSRLSPESAYNSLRKGQPIFFHPPQGDWQQLDDLEDLRVYLYSRESREQAPGQQIDLGEGFSSGQYQQYP